MQCLSEIYSERFFRARDRYHWRAPIVCGAILFMWRHTPIRTTIDVGAATGDLTDVFARLGIEAYAIEGSPNCLPHIVCPRDRMLIHDLRKPLDVSDPPVERFDLVTCFEVLEHVEEEYADVLLDNLCLLSDRLLTSACPPNPARKGTSGGSVHHVNEQYPGYWEAKFIQRGYGRVGRVERLFRDLVHPYRHKYGIKAWYENCLYFEKT